MLDASSIVNTRDFLEQSFVLPCFTEEQVKLFRPIFKFLNDKDRDILYLIFVSQKKQKEVQQILERSQPSLCYDIKRIRLRLKFIFYLQSIQDLFVDFLQNRSQQFSSEEIEVLVLMFFTSSYTLSAKIVGKSQLKIRYIYNRCLVKLLELKIWDMWELFQIVKENLNIIRRTYKEGKNLS